MYLIWYEGNWIRKWQRELIEVIWENIEETVSIFSKDVEFEVVLKKNAIGKTDGDSYTVQ